MYYVAAKNLSSRELVVLRANEFFNLDEKGNLYSSFEPKSVKDFNAKVHYGRKEGDFMILHYILDMSEDEKELERRVGAPRGVSDRIVNPKRLSSDNPRLPVASFKSSDEEQAAKAETKSALKALSKVSKKVNESTIYNDLQASKLKAKAVSEGKNTSFPKKSSDGEELEAAAAAAATDNLPACTGNCALAAHLKEEVINLKKEMNELKSAQSIGGSKTSKAASSFRELSEEELQELGEPYDGTLADDKIYFGENVLVDLKEIRGVETKSFNEKTRIMDMLKLIYKDDYGRRCLDPSRKKEKDGLPIHTLHISVMSRLLGAMGWDGSPPNISVEGVKATIRRLSYRIREKNKVETMDPNVRIKLMAEKKEKAKNYRENAKRKTTDAKDTTESGSKKRRVAGDSGKKKEGEEEEENDKLKDMKSDVTEESGIETGKSKEEENGKETDVVEAESDAARETEKKIEAGDEEEGNNKVSDALDIKAGSGDEEEEEETQPC